MLKVYICPKCKAVRYVSKYKTHCYKCNVEMVLSTIPYEEYITLDTTNRNLLIEKLVSS
ncbi:MAG: DNA-directed RNA polymerase subunit M [Velocimicrobium sp.]